MNFNFDKMNFEQFLKAIIGIQFVVIGVLWTDHRNEIRILNAQHVTEMTQKDADFKDLNNRHIEFVEVTKFDFYDLENKFEKYRDSVNQDKKNKYENIFSNRNFHGGRRANTVQNK